MAGPLEFFGDVIGGAGNIVGGVGKHLGTGLKAVRDAERAELALPRLRQQAIEVNEQFAILKGDFSPEEKENAARKIIKAVQPKLYEQRLRQDPNTKFYQPILSREEQKKKALDPYGRQYGGQGVDPYVKGVEDIGKIEAAREKFVFRKMNPETAAYFDMAEQSVKDRMRRDRTIRKGDGLGSLPKAEKVDNRDYFAPGGELDVFEGMGAPKQRNLMLEGQLPPSPDEGMFDRLDSFKPKTRGPESIEDYYQASTETVPEENIPKTYKQLGITGIEDQKTFQEMQNALPDVDMRQEYENDPESMQRLIQLWKAREINKSNLHKFFSAIQQKARQALGIA